jgi:hypothetical protein
MMAMRIAASIVGIILSSFLFLMSLVGAEILHTAYIEGTHRGALPHVWAEQDAIFIVATLISSFATYKCLRSWLGQRRGLR